MLMMDIKATATIISTSEMPTRCFLPNEPLPSESLARDRYAACISGN
jgi:hypothetical protein